MRGARIGWLVVAAVLLTGCAAADEKRNGDQENDPDAISDATQVTVYRNAQATPNVVLFCVGGLRFASIAAVASPALVRIPEQDGLCRDGATK